MLFFVPGFLKGTDEQLSAKPMAKLNNAHRLVCGILILLIVDIIWVASSELSEVLYYYFY